ncbi:MAG TPA: type II secretion system F family protein [Jatrophihabitans sp.]|jgi:pilus assembly protein TadC
MTVTWLLLAAALTLAGDRRRRTTSRRAAEPSPALALDLAAAALRSGQPLSAALRLAAPTAGGIAGDVLARTGRMVELGADPSEAWRAAEQVASLQQVAVAARRSAESGARLADAFERAAVELRSQARTTAEARAQRVGVWAIAPLGLCFLPAFVCLGIVPVIAGLVRELLT